MGDLVNLRNARKQRARADASRQAEENRLRFGRTKAQKQAQALTAERDAAALEAHRRDKPDSA